MKMLKKSLLLIVLALGVFFGIKQYQYSASRLPAIKVGILHSLTGVMAVSESAVVKALLLAIIEINERGGVLGRKIEPLVRDGRSDCSVFKEEAEKLIIEDKVSVVFGCWTSSCRKTVKPLFEKHNHLLIYPVQYEGLEESSNIIYLGAAPNQQIIPAVKWSFDNLGESFFLVGSDYIFPRTANAIIKDQVAALGGTVAGEEYVPLKSKDFSHVMEEVVQSKPQVIVNTLNGDSNFAFFDAMKAAPELNDIPVMSFSIGETEISEYLKMKDRPGSGQDDRQSHKFLFQNHYAAWNYFQSFKNSKNRAFIKGMEKEYGNGIVTNDPMASAYAGVYLWAQAVEAAGTDEADKTIKSMKKQSFDSPGGYLYIDPQNNHTWKTVFIGKVDPAGQLKTVWTSSVPVSPIPYPAYRSKREWNTFLNNLFSLWGEKWANPGINKEVLERKKKDGEKILQSLVKAGEVLSAVEESNKKYGDISQPAIRLLDRAWRKKKYTPDFNPSLFKDSPAGKTLNQFMDSHPRFSEIFVTDRQGLNVAITNRTTDFYQADERWWKEAFSKGKGKVYFTHIEYDKSAASWGLAICLPVYNAKKETIGVMKALVNIQSLATRPSNRVFLK